ncbi:anthranilate synthase family protein [Streptomyces sp. NBC_01077]|uniref:anthranilate synthase family protein n=1 Tax=Streptomyces sp. NBC_01077 TaxID=2903746 RepID=UPI00386E2468|nr:anthranilate synthase family protein [Streptomyces sp. NBC_01077]WSV43632.1 anthranilate synthase family protein [Streptomyces sp. NBC_01077]
MTLPLSVAELVDRLTSEDAPPFALLRRNAPHVTPGTIEVLTGTIGTYERLAQLPVVPDAPACGGPVHDLLALVPYRQIRERGFEAQDDGTPLQALQVTQQRTLPVALLLAALPETEVDLADGGFVTSDHQYAETVRRIISDEIGQGEGANFVIRRDFTATIRNFSLHLALGLFRRLMEQERGAYWTYLVHTGERVLLGASPEVHVRQAQGTVVMNPISGTYRYPDGGPTLSSLMEFLQDTKESEELTMVVDEELKMMCSVGDRGGQVIGPRLKQMARLAHTEYELRGRTSMDVRDVLRETMFAATVTGSPLQNAASVISRYEQSGRGYYAGALALIGRSASGGQTMDSPICIRTADIDVSTGRTVVRVGATLVRNSHPEAEVAETHVKAAAILGAIGAIESSPQHQTTPGEGHTLAESYQVQAALYKRRGKLASFWLKKQDASPPTIASRALVVDCGDGFTAMLTHQLRSLGHPVVVESYDSPGLSESVAFHDGIVLLGPGPGDPTSTTDPRVRTLRTIAQAALQRDAGVLGVCLGHQMLATELGLPIRRMPKPRQGTQEEITLFGRRETVGFYNTFTTWCDDLAEGALLDQGIELARDPRTGEVHALRGSAFASVQFHPESVLSTRGIGVVAELVHHVERSAHKNLRKAWSAR